MTTVCSLCALLSSEPAISSLRTNAPVASSLSIGTHCLCRRTRCIFMKPNRSAKRNEFDLLHDEDVSACRCLRSIGMESSEASKVLGEVMQRSQASSGCSSHLAFCFTTSSLLLGVSLVFAHRNPAQRDHQYPAAATGMRSRTAHP